MAEESQRVLNTDYSDDLDKAWRRGGSSGGTGGSGEDPAADYGAGAGSCTVSITCRNCVGQKERMKKKENTYKLLLKRLANYSSLLFH